MPISVYSVQVHGRDVNGGHRCANKEEAQALYDTLAKAVNAPEEFFEIKIGETVATARKSNISGFSMSVHFEETPEERKQRAIEQIERGGVGYDNQCYPEKAVGGLIGSRLF